MTSTEISMAAAVTRISINSGFTTGTVEISIANSVFACIGLVETNWTVSETTSAEN